MAERDLIVRVQAVLDRSRKVIAEADALVTRTRLQSAEQEAEANMTPSATDERVRVESAKH
jgi:hypothetical protein